MGIRRAGGCVDQRDRPRALPAEHPEIRDYARAAGFRQLAGEYLFLQPTKPKAANFAWKASAYPTPARSSQPAEVCDLVNLDQQAFRLEVSRRRLLAFDEQLVPTQEMGLGFEHWRPCRVQAVQVPQCRHAIVRSRRDDLWGFIGEPSPEDHRIIPVIGTA